MSIPGNETVRESQHRAPTPVVQAQRVSKSFPGQLALDRVDFEVRAGEIHALAGQNGSGKSTLIHVLAGSHLPDEGSIVTVAGEPLKLGSPADSHARGLRFVHQHFGVIDELNAMENVALSNGYTGSRGPVIDWKTQREHTEELLSLLGIEFDVTQPMGNFRPIDRSAVAIARAMDRTAGDIRLLVLDEPTAALPPAEVELLFELVAQIRDAGIGIVYVSHRLDEIFQLADRVTVLRNGKKTDTTLIDGIDRPRLIEMIVGRPVEESTQARTASTTAAGVALKVRGLRSALVEGIDFEVGKGEILGFAGILGSGREQIPYAMVGAQPVEVDQLTVDGKDYGRLTPSLAKEAGIALVPGNRRPGSAVPEFSIMENITLPALDQYRTGGTLINSALEAGTADRWIEEVQVDPPRPDKLFAQLSGGNQQKVLVAKWLNINPLVVILDEPTAGVDVGAREAIYELLKRYSEEGTSFVVSSSDPSDLIAVCTRVLIVNKGLIVGELSGSEISEGGLLEAMSIAAKKAPERTEVE